MLDEEKKAEEYIISKYKLNELYLEDNEETRPYMHVDVHEMYEEEYQAYLAGYRACCAFWRNSLNKLIHGKVNI